MLRLRGRSRFHFWNGDIWNNNAIRRLCKHHLWLLSWWYHHCKWRQLWGMRCH